MAPTYDNNNNLVSGDVNCAMPGTPYQNYMWSGLVGLFLKMEQINLYNEINFNLPTTFPDNATAIRRTIGGYSSARRTAARYERRDSDRLRCNLPTSRAVRLPRQHGRRDSSSRPPTTDAPTSLSRWPARIRFA